MAREHLQTLPLQHRVRRGATAREHASRPFNTSTTIEPATGLGGTKRVTYWGANKQIVCPQRPMSAPVSRRIHRESNESSPKVGVLCGASWTCGRQGMVQDDDALGGLIATLPKDQNGKLVPTVISDFSDGAKSQQNTASGFGARICPQPPSTQKVEAKTATSGAAGIRQSNWKSRPLSARDRVPISQRRGGRLVPYTNK